MKKILLSLFLTLGMLLPATAQAQRHHHGGFTGYHHPYHNYYGYGYPRHSYYPNYYGYYGYYGYYPYYYAPTFGYWPYYLTPSYGYYSPYGYTYGQYYYWPGN